MKAKYNISLQKKFEPGSCDWNNKFYGMTLLFKMPRYREQGLGPLGFRVALNLIWGLNCSDKEIPGAKTLSETYFNGPLEGLLNVQPLAHDGLIQLPLKSQQIHVSLRLWDQFPDLEHNKSHW